MSDLKGYINVTIAYWAFTLTDGALRMIVLLHFHSLGFSPFDIALLFLLYEVMGVLTNLFGGWLASLFGLRLSLFAGLALQICALLMLSALSPEWTVGFSVAYVMASQALSGGAKDFTKMSSKSAVKLVAGIGDQGDESRLFKWVAILTGSKNALKGVGFFLGGFLLSTVGFKYALYGMAAVLFIILIYCLFTVGETMGKAKNKVSIKHLLSKSREINFLSAARVFLFGSRDVWFVVGLPVFLSAELGWNYSEVGTFMAAWVIGYGFIQASAPKLLPGTKDAPSGAKAARLWAFILALLPAAMALGLQVGIEPTLVVIGGLGLFALVFAINSAVHSYLILAYSDHDQVAAHVGFYYMANAVGRLAGTLLSGLAYQWGGLNACLILSAVMVTLAAVLSLGLQTTSKPTSS
ncbi:MAG: organoarsenical effux MFS transporter ArsJ [Alphaproteobacteria bacterium]|nr:organoarsenical effux MFS transporter ArsJ [Alphaproteobacteria bacterium]